MSSESSPLPPVPFTLVSTSFFSSRLIRLCSVLSGYPVEKLSSLLSLTSRVLSLVLISTSLDPPFGDQAGLLVDQLVVGRRLGPGIAGDHLRGDEGQDHHEQDRESRAFEKTPHGRKISVPGRFCALGVQRGDVFEVAVVLSVVEAVADREAVRDLEADVARREVDPQALGLGQQRADLERGRRRALRLRIRYWRVRPESMMSSTISTWRSSIGASRSLRMRTTPEESVCEP